MRAATADHCRREAITQGIRSITQVSAEPRYRTTVRVSQRDLLIGRCKHLRLVPRKLAHLLFQRRELLLEPGHLCDQRLCRLLPVSHVELAQIAPNTLLELGTPPLNLRPGEVLYPVIHRLDLAPAARDARRPHKPYL